MARYLNSLPVCGGQQTMQTERWSSASAALVSAALRGGSPQRVLIVNGSQGVLEVLEPVLDASNYDVIFVESSAHAYSQIRKVQPDLVILCLEFDDAEGLRVLSMLKLDAETRDIPVVTYTSTGIEEVADGDRDASSPIFARTFTSRMN